MSEAEVKKLIKRKKAFIIAGRICRYAGIIFLTLGIIGFLLFIWAYSCISGGTDFPAKFVIFLAIFQNAGFITLGFIFYMFSYTFTTLGKLIEEIELTI